jgi:magnesium transporter
MIQVHVFRKRHEETDVPVADLSEVRQEPGTLVWVDVVNASKEELAQMGEEFQIHPLALEDCAHRHQRPKVEEYPGQALVVAYGAQLRPVAGAADRENHCALHELDLIVGENFLVDFHRGCPIDVEEVTRRVTARPELATQGAGFLLYVLLDQLVDTFFPTLDGLGEQVEDLEEAVFAGDPSVQQRIFTLRKDLVVIRRVAGPMRDAMIVLLRRDLDLFNGEVRRYLQDIYDHLIRIVESVEDYQDLAASALEANLSVVSNRINEVARTLTAYAAIFAVITVFTGLYGMNFHHMPELAWRFGYLYALAVMGGLGGGMWLYFRRKGWL